MTSHHAPAPALRRKEERDPNKVRVKAASSEVISNLLASFSAISLPPDEPEYTYPDQNPRTPPRTLQPDFAYAAQRVPHLHPRQSREPSLDLPELRSPYKTVSGFPRPAASAGDDDDDDTVAQAPVIRTSRPPIQQTSRKVPWRSRPTNHATYPDRSGLSLSPGPRIPQNDDDGLMSRLASLTSLTRDKTSGFQSPSSILSGRPSFDNRRNDASRTGSLTAIHSSSTRPDNNSRNDFSQSSRVADLRQSEIKGKARARAISPVQEVSSNNSRPPSASQHLPQTLSVNSRLANRSPQATTFRDETGLVILHPPRVSPPSPVFASHSRLGSRDGPPSIPSRTASLQYAKVPKPPKPHKKSRWGKTKVLQEPTPAPILEAPKSRSSSADTVFLNPQLNDQGKLESQKVRLDMDEDNEVTRRIRELRAANEKRRQDYAEAIPQTGSMPLDSLDPPRSGSARPQRQYSGGRRWVESSFPTDEELPPSTFGRNGAMLGLPAPGSLAPPETDFNASPSSGSRPSHGSAEASPAVSRSSSRSRSKRWSVSDFAKGPSSPEKSHRRVNSKDGNKYPQYPPMIEEARASDESLREQVDMFLTGPKLSRKIPALEDFERQIAFSDVGDPKGHVIFCCLGMGLTRYVTAYYEELAFSLGLRLITPDRPGVGDSTAYKDTLKTPLNWPDDVRAICRYLGIGEFSILAHSAGAIYGLATALRMPQRISGNIHLLAPWIPPSQMIPIGISAADSPTSIPRSQRFLRLLPTSFLKLSNSSLLSSRHAVGGSPKTPSKKTRRSNDIRGSSSFTSPRPSMGGSSSGRHNTDQVTSFSLFSSARPSGRTSFEHPQHLSPLDDIVELPSDQNINEGVMDAGVLSPRPGTTTGDEGNLRQQRFDALLTPAVWELATRKANPAVDLLVCLERNHKIGFRYADISQPVIIHHGSKDARVPLENVKWLARTMQHAEVRVLEGEGHGLMASASVIGTVLVEMGRNIDKKSTMAEMRERLMWDD